MMKAALPAFAVLTFLSSAAWGQDWIPLDSRTRGAGNAGVAFAQGPSAGYWNPASLSRDAEKIFDFSTSYGFAVYAFADVALPGDTILKVDRISTLIKDNDFQSIQDRMILGTSTPPQSDSDVQTAIRLVDDLAGLNQKGTGAILHPGGGIDFKFGPIGIYSRAMGSVGLKPVADFTNAAFTLNRVGFFAGLTSGTPTTSAGMALSTKLQTLGGLTSGEANTLAAEAETSVGSAVGDPAFVNAMVGVAKSIVTNDGTNGSTLFYGNSSGLEARGLAQWETGVSLGVPVLPTMLNVGIGFKEIISETSFTAIHVSDLESGSDTLHHVRDDLKNNRERSNQFNMDLGVLVTPYEWGAIGLTGRNLIPMRVKIDAPEGHLKLDPTYRMGVLFTPIDLIHIGADIDLNETESAVLPGYKYQMMGAGIEFDFPVIKLRGGVFDNIASSKDGVTYTAGLGLKIFVVTLDLSAQMASKRQEIREETATKSSQKIPERAGVGLTLGMELFF